MLKIGKIKKFVLGVIVTLIMVATSSVYASSITTPTTTTVPTIPTQGTSSTIQTVSTPTPTPTASTTTTTTVTPTATPTSNSSSSVYNKTNLPKTGVDSSLLFIMLVCVVFAIFAYKKISEYNRIKY